MFPIRESDFSIPHFPSEQEDLNGTGISFPKLPVSRGFSRIRNSIETRPEGGKYHDVLKFWRKCPIESQGCPIPFQDRPENPVAPLFSGMPCYLRNQRSTDPATSKVRRDKQVGKVDTATRTVNIVPLVVNRITANLAIHLRQVSLERGFLPETVPKHDLGRKVCRVVEICPLLGARQTRDCVGVLFLSEANEG